VKIFNCHTVFCANLENFFNIIKNKFVRERQSILSHCENFVLSFVYCGHWASAVVESKLKGYFSAIVIRKSKNTMQSERLDIRMQALSDILLLQFNGLI